MATIFLTIHFLSIEQNYQDDNIMPPAPTKSPSHRLSISESELQQLVSILDTLRSTGAITPELASLRAKCKNIIEKILSGIKTPDYIPTGRIAGKNAVSLEMLGCTAPAIEEYFNKEHLLQGTTLSGKHDFIPINNSEVTRIFAPRTDPDVPSDDEFAAAQKELDEAIQNSSNKRMSDEEWKEQRLLYPFLPEIQP